MTFDFFEGPAGTGKTHNLVERAGELVQQGVLGEERKLLALSYMNGARRRLEARLGANALFRRRFECQTFDVFGRILAARRRSLLAGNDELIAQAAALGEFDGPCFLAGSLLQNAAVRQWVRQSFPIVLVDEAQDLDEPRLSMLQGLSTGCHIVAAADGFQCLTDGQNAEAVVEWLKNAGQTHYLSQPKRTSRQGLLDAALAVRELKDIKSVLNETTFKGRSIWNGPGFRLLEIPAKQAGLVAWTISNEMALRNGYWAILTPDTTNDILRDALEIVQSRVWKRKNGQTFGPFPYKWDRKDEEEAQVVLAEIAMPEKAGPADFAAILKPHASHAPIAQAIDRIDRLRRTHGETEFERARILEIIRESFRLRSRLGFRQQRGHGAMTIHRAKNREFENVIVLWPHSATGSAAHLRRLLYNGITRAIRHCSVIVLGEGRLSKPPFAP
ncbi:MAG: ATP-binding domain-containing protein [Alphaproteobacteria bacterium]